MIGKCVENERQLIGPNISNFKRVHHVDKGWLSVDHIRLSKGLLESPVQRQTLFCPKDIKDRINGNTP
jgi:hypothetical protein